MNYDVIIAGAGPAGLSCLIHLRKLNKDLKILLVEKHKFPRNKLCAGYLTNKSVNLLKELGLNVNDIKYKLVKGLSIKYKDKTRISVNNHGLYCQELVDRSILDYELFKLVKKDNIDILEKAKIDSVDEDKFSIFINNKEYKYKYLIFADGVMGYSSKYNITKKKYFAMQVNFKKEEKAKIDMYFGITKKGYAWCSSSGNYTNIGFCDIYNKDIDYQNILDNFIEKLGYKKDCQNIKSKGFFVPYGINKNVMISTGIYLIGDAAGLVDPLTLAGVSYAILSGKYVAKSIVKNNNDIYFDYLKKVKAKYFILKIMFNLLYNPVFMFLFIRVGGHFLGRTFSFLLDRLVLNKKSSFHE